MHASASLSRRRTLRPAARRRGSLLITALLLSAVIALSLGSFLSLASQSTNLSYRGFYAGSAMNAAETGLEEAMWAIRRRLDGETGVWSRAGWTIETNGAARRNFPLGTISGGATSRVQIFVSNANLAGAEPFVVARGIITPPSGRGPAIERWIKITLKKRSLFSTGLVARDLITFSGNNASVDAYDSRLGAYTPNSFANRFARGSAGSASVRTDRVNFDLGNADIWGFVAVGTETTASLYVGPNGTIGPFGTSSGTVAPGHVSTKFTANFEDITHPTTYTGTGAYSPGDISSATTLPRPARTTTTGNGNNAVITHHPADVPAADGKYYYNVDSITGSLTIADNVVIRITATSGNAINIGGNDSITINAPSAGKTPKLEIFTEADVKIAGNGVANSGRPEAFFLWGTRPQSRATAQSIDISGNGNLSGVVYAPNADISLKGGGNSGNVFGSIVGKNITLTGNSAFHYDESLADLDAGEPLGLNKWDEFVTHVDRQSHSHYFDGL